MINGLLGKESIFFKAKHFSYNVENRTRTQDPPFPMPLPFEMLSTLPHELGMMGAKKASNNSFIVIVLFVFRAIINSRNSFIVIVLFVSIQPAMVSWNKPNKTRYMDVEKLV